MKTLKSLMTVAVILLITTSFSLAQKGNKGCCAGQENHKNIPNLTEEQSKKIDGMRVTHQKEMQQLHSVLNEKEASLNTLTIADNPDMKSINDVIDEIGKIQTDMMKKREAHRQEVRKLLTPEQKVAFDSKPHHGKMMKKECDGNKNKHHKKCESEK